MKRILLAAAMAACALPGLSQAQVGVSVQVNQPGVYGRIDIGGVPPPVVVYQQPVVIAPSPVAVYQRPIYLHVPAGYERNWGQYCGRYSACGQPVYFVREDWYQQHWVPAHRRDIERRGYDRRDDGRRGDDRRDHDRHEQHDRGHGHDRDHEDHGRGHGHDRDR